MSDEHARDGERAARGPYHGSALPRGLSAGL